MWTRSIISILCLLLTSITFSQSSFGDDWIEDGQTYFKFYLEEDGIYRISHAVLIELGIPAEQVQSGQYQIFSYGQEVPLQVSTEDILEIGDFITFYGQGPDGSIDGLLYNGLLPKTNLCDSNLLVMV